jgi:hypothetical protein
MFNFGQFNVSRNRETYIYLFIYLFKQIKLLRATRRLHGLNVFQTESPCAAVLLVGIPQET